MIIIAGLGNPGDKYAGTKHNTGFSVIYNISDRYNIPLNKAEHKSLTGRGILEGEKVLLAMPQTYMNLSGDALRLLTDYYEVDPETELIVVYDDVSLPVGRLRIRKKGSAGGHNGIKDIIAKLGTDTFARVKVGVGEKPEYMDLADHVLSRFSKDELPLVRESVERAADAVCAILRDGADSAMNGYN